MNDSKNPIPSQFDILLEQGKITVDFLLCRDSGGDTYSFKVGTPCCFLKARHISSMPYKLL